MSNEVIKISFETEKLCGSLTQPSSSSTFTKHRAHLCCKVQLSDMKLQRFDQRYCPCLVECLSNADRNEQSILKRSCTKPATKDQPLVGILPVSYIFVFSVKRNPRCWEPKSKDTLRRQRSWHRHKFRSIQSKNNDGRWLVSNFKTFNSRMSTGLNPDVQLLLSALHPWCLSHIID